MNKVLIVLGSGGHTKQMMLLKNKLSKNSEYHYLIAYEDNLTPNKVSENKHFVHRPKDVNDGFFTKIFKTVRCTVESLIVMLKVMPDVVISAGPGTAVPISFIAKAFGKKVVYIESWSRTASPSNSGKLVYKIADLFFVQWPNMNEYYPKAIYRGRLA